MQQWSIIYEYCETHPNCTDEACQKTVVVHAIAVPEIDLRTSVHTPSKRSLTLRSHMPVAQLIGLMLLALGLGGMVGPMIPEIRMETAYRLTQANAMIRERFLDNAADSNKLPAAAPVIFNPLVDPSGAPITPVNTDFSLVVPSVGINAPIIADVDPTNHTAYSDALSNGVAQASTSFTPDQNGTMYLFSHDTNYDWFVKDLNAVFYLLKNLKTGDIVVVYYKGKRYDYLVSDKKVVPSTDTSYLTPTAGKKSLILETCWPPGSTYERLLLFANPVQDLGIQI